MDILKYVEAFGLQSHILMMMPHLLMKLAGHFSDKLATVWSCQICQNFIITQNIQGKLCSNALQQTVGLLARRCEFLDPNM